MEDLVKDLEGLSGRASNFLLMVEATKIQQVDYEKKLRLARQDTKDRSGAHLLLQHIAERLNEQNEAQAAKLATLALNEAFPDQKLSLRAEHSNLRGNPATILTLRDEVRNAEGEPCEAFGGGPASLLGIVLRVVTVVKQGLSRILILDEPNVHVSEQYQVATAKLMRKLCEPKEKNGLGFDMLVITHIDTFKTAAHRSYHAVTGEDGKSLKLVDPNTIMESMEVLDQRE